MSKKTRKRWKRRIVFLMTLVIIFADMVLPYSFMPPVFHPMEVSAGGTYNSDWRNWTQSASGNSNVKQYGCRVVAFAKIIKESGWAGFSDPDEYFNIGVQNGWFQTGVTENGSFGNALNSYITSRGGTCNKVREISLNKNATSYTNEIMGYLRQGYYVTLSCTSHTAYISPSASVAAGKPIVYDSGKSTTTSLVHDFNSDKANTGNYWTNLRVWQISGGMPINSGNNPEGTVDSVTGGIQSINIRGWAFDRDNTSKSIEIHAYIGDEGHGIVADTYRPDVNSVYGVGDYHGFESTIRTGKTGEQHVQIYAINVGEGSNSLLWEGNITIGADSTSPTISDIRVYDVSTEGYTVSCVVTDDQEIDRVQFPTWTLANGQDDIDQNWYSSNESRGSKVGDMYTYRVNISDHNNELGSYATHIWAFDKNGNVGTGATGVYLENEPPLISDVIVSNISIDGYKIICTVTDESGIDRVQFPTWTLENGQDDINKNWWSDAGASGTIDGDKVTFYVKRSEHNGEVLDYATHIYAFDKLGNCGTATGFGALSLIGDVQDLGTDFVATIKNVYAGTVATKDSDDNVTGRKFTGSDNQYWYFIRKDNGTYEILSLNDKNKCLDAYGMQDKNGTNVQAWERNGTVAQEWYIYMNDRGYFLVPSFSKTKGLDLAAASPSDGTNIQLCDNIGIAWGGVAGSQPGDNSIFLIEKKEATEEELNQQAADDVLEKIQAIGEVDLSKGEKIEEARAAYDALTDVQKALITDEQLKVLTDAEATYSEIVADKAAADAVLAKIDVLSDTEQIAYTEEWNERITETRGAYEKLTEKQKSLVASKLSILEVAETRYAELKTADDKSKAAAAVAKINAIGTVTYTEESKTLIEEARAAFNGLTADQKAFINVVNLETLLEAEAKYKELASSDAEKEKADKAAADSVVEKINAIGTVTYTAECKALIEEARASYKVLTVKQKSFIGGEQLKTLTDAENTYVELMKADDERKAAEAEAKQEADKAAAEAVVAKIEKIGEVTYTDASKALIEEAREAYNGLTADRKALITDLQLKVLTDAEASYAELKVTAEAKQKADRQAADDVIAKIENIGAVAYIDACRSLIEEARKAYDALTEEQKELITDAQLKTLTVAETIYAELKEQDEIQKADKAAADKVAAQIIQIGEVRLTDDSKALIEKAREAYNALTDAQKDFITATQLKTLTDAEERYQKLADDRLKADAAIAKIDAIGTVAYTPESKALIEDARKAYDELTLDQKIYISAAKLETLLGAEVKYKELASTDAEKEKVDKAAADVVIARIAAIGTVEYTAESKVLIEEARAAYNVLTADQKALITATQLKTLTDAETAYAELKKADDERKAAEAEAKQKADKSAADAVTAKIEAIGEIEFSDSFAEAIGEAREAYDSLTEKEKALVNPEILKKLTDAEAEYERLETEAAEKQQRDEDAAEDVISKINAIGDVTLDASVKKAIESARKAYDALTDEQKKLVREEYVEILADAEKEYMAEEKKAEQAAEEAGKADALKKDGEDAMAQNTAKTSKSPLAEGKVFTVGTNVYIVTDDNEDEPEVALKQVTDKKVKKVTVPSTVTDRNGVTYIVTALANNALKGCKKLKTVKLPDTLLEIGNNALSGCESLTKVTIPENVETIGAKAFYNAKKLRTIIIKSTDLERVGKNALKGIHKKAVIKVPKSQKKFYQKLFQKKGQAATVKIK